MMLIVAALTVVTGCSTTVTGTATNSAVSSLVVSAGNEISQIPQTGGSTGEQADSGGYTTTPNVLASTAGSEEAGRIAEGARLAEYVLVPTFVLTDYTVDSSGWTVVIKDPAALVDIVADPIPGIAEKDGMISGFSSARQSVPDDSGFANSVINAVLTFPSTEQATAAAADLNDGIGAKPGSSNVVAIPGFDEQRVAKVQTYDDSVGAEVFLAHNSIVHYVRNQTKDGSGESMAQTLGKLLEAQIAASDSFVPTQVENLNRLPADRDGMLAHTLLRPADAGDNTDVTTNRVFGIRGMKHFFVNPLDDEATINAAGIDLVARGLTALYRAKDDTGALLLQAEYWRQYGEYFPDAQEYIGPSQVPGIRCLTTKTDLTACVFTNGRYTVEASSNTVEDIDAQVLAQYNLLNGF